MAPLLELDQACLAFGGLRALHELDLRVEEHEIVSVIGPNGAGKSTVFNVVTGVYRPGAGEVRMHGGDSDGRMGVPDRVSSDSTAPVRMRWR